MRKLKAILAICLALFICLSAVACDISTNTKITKTGKVSYNVKMVVSEIEMQEVSTILAASGKVTNDLRYVFDSFRKESVKSVVDGVTYYTMTEKETVDLSDMNESLLLTAPTTKSVGEYSTTDFWAYSEGTLTGDLMAGTVMDSYLELFKSMNINVNVEASVTMPYVITKTNMEKVDDYTVKSSSNNKKTEYIITEKSTAAWTKAADPEKEILKLAKSKMAASFKQIKPDVDVKYVTKSKIFITITGVQDINLYEVEYKVNSGKWHKYKTVKNNDYQIVQNKNYLGLIKDNNYSTFSVIFKNFKANRKYSFRVRGLYKSVDFGTLYTAFGAKSINTVDLKNAPAVKSLTKGKKSFTVKLKKKYPYVNGYEIKYSLKKNFKGSKTKSTKNLKTTIKGLKSGKIYYVKVRKYRKNCNGKKLYSPYSKVKKVKVK